MVRSATIYTPPRIDERDGMVDLKQFKPGQIIDHMEGEQSWMIIDVREHWLKVLPLFSVYEGDPRTHVRFNRFTVDTAIKNGWWELRRN